LDQGKTLPDFQWARDPDCCHILSDLNVEVNDRTQGVAPHTLGLLQVEVDSSLCFERHIEWEYSGSMTHNPFAGMAWEEVLIVSLSRHRQPTCYQQIRSYSSQHRLFLVTVLARGSQQEGLASRLACLGLCSLAAAGAVHSSEGTHLPSCKRSSDTL
jgi:hypothetical protein